MKRIDIHSHVIPARIVDEIARSPKEFAARIEGESSTRRVVHEQGYAYPLFDEFHNPHAKLESMDRKGIDVSIISPAPPMFYYWADVDLAAKSARLVNDGIADMVAVQPSRLRGMATIPLQHPDAAINEMERVVREYEFKAIEIGTSVEGVQLAEDKFRPILRRAQELGLFVFAHPYYVGAKNGLECYYLTNLIGNPLDTTVMLANLMYSGALDELKDFGFAWRMGGAHPLPDRTPGPRSSGPPGGAPAVAHLTEGAASSPLFRQSGVRSAGAALSNRLGRCRPRLYRYGFSIRHGRRDPRKPYRRFRG